MTQPFDRGAMCKAPGNPDEALGEFWEDDPWEIAFKHNLSAYERNRMYLNLDGNGFIDISEVTSADVDGDSRSAVALDYDSDGNMDLLLRQTGGDPLVLFRNCFSAGNYLNVSLRGVKNNSLGIGAKITARIGSRNVVRELFPINSFHSQARSQVHIGLGTEDRVTSLTIQWPDGMLQTLQDVSCNQHILVTESESQYRVIRPGEGIE